MEWFEATALTLVASASRASFTCRSPHSPRICRTASMMWLMPPDEPKDSKPPWVLTGSAPPSSRRPPSREAPPSPLAQIAEILELQQHGDREGIVELRDVDVGRLDAGHAEGLPGRHGLDGAGEAEALLVLPAGPGGAGEVAEMVVGLRLAGAEDADGRLLEVAGALEGGDEDRAAAVAGRAAIEKMQGRRDHPRAEDVVDADRFALESLRVQGRVLAAGDGNGGELFGGRAELVHVALRQHGIDARER